MGNLNREIRRTNNLLRSIKRTILQLRDWLSDISEKIHRQAMIEDPADQSLTDLLLCYMEIRKEERADWSRGGQMKGTSNDLKKVSQTIAYLREHHIETVDALDKRIRELEESSENFKKRINENKGNIREIDKLLNAIDTVKRTEPVKQKYDSIHWKSRREKFYAENAKDLKAYYAAMKIVEANRDLLPVNRKEMRAEQQSLVSENEKLNGFLEGVKEDLKQLREVKRCVDKVLPEKEETGPVKDTAQRGIKPEAERRSVLGRLAEKQQESKQRERQRQPERTRKRQQNMEL